MKINFLLLLLATLTAVALSQEWKPHRVNIQLQGKNLFWAADNNDKNVILKNHQPNDSNLKWTTVGFGGPTVGFISCSAIDISHGRSVQSKGLHKNLAISSISNSSDHAQLWRFQPAGGDFVFIQPCEFIPNKAATAVSGPKGIKTVKLERFTGKSNQKWLFRKAL